MKCTEIKSIIPSLNFLVFFFITIIFTLLSSKVILIHGGSNSSELQVAIIFNSSEPDQYKLYLATMIGYRSRHPFYSDHTEPIPVVIDLANSNIQIAAPAAQLHSLTPGLQFIISLLTPTELESVLDVYEQLRKNADEVPLTYLEIILLRECIYCSNASTDLRWPTINFKCGGDLTSRDYAIATATALIHHATSLGVSSLIPIMEDYNKQDLMQGKEQADYIFQVYKETNEAIKRQLNYLNSLNMASYLTIEILQPIYSLSPERLQSLLHNSQLQERRLAFLMLTKNLTLASEIMSRTWKIQNEIGLPYLIHIFSPWGMDFIPTEAFSYGGVPETAFYTVEYGGSYSQEHQSHEDRNVMQKLSALSGPSPFVLKAKIAYKTGAAFSTDANRRNFSTSFRTATTIFYGISPKPKFQKQSVQVGMLLQPSDFILEDTITVPDMNQSQKQLTSLLNVSELSTEVDGSFDISSHKLATSSTFSKQHLVNLATSANLKWNCKDQQLIVTMYDPFNNMPYKYSFKSLDTIPEQLIIPNGNGFGLEFYCFQEAKLVHNGTQNAGEGTNISIRIACTPTEKSAAANSQEAWDDMSCFQSISNQELRLDNTPSRRRRSHSASAYTYPNTYYAQAAQHRDDSYQAPPKPVTDSINLYGPGMGVDINNVDMTTTGETEPPSTEAPTEAPTPAPAPLPPPPKLPDLRAILKAAKPFVGGCIGSSMGCASCVIVLGRLPLTAVPAICSGPCMVTTFGQCGALLGRVASETTVICTELFRQGYLDIETFIADAEFGRMMQRNSPVTLKGYQILATPVVKAMKISPAFTWLVSKITIPWAKYMRNEVLGYSDSETEPIYDNQVLIGEWLHYLGFPVCTIVGYISICATNCIQEANSVAVFLSSSIILFILILSLALRHKKVK